MIRASKHGDTVMRIANLPLEWTVATTCSGCGTFEIALRSVANAMSGYPPVDDGHDFEVPC